MIHLETYQRGTACRVDGEDGLTVHTTLPNGKTLKVGATKSGLVLRDFWDGADCEMGSAMSLKGKSGKLLSVRFVKAEKAK